MSADTMNFPSVDVRAGPTFKRSLSHQIKKLMCYNRHLNRDSIVNRHSAIVDNINAVCQQSASNRSTLIDANVAQVDILRNRYEQSCFSLQTKLAPARERNMPKQKFGDIVMGIMAMPELPPFASADIQHAVRLSDIKTDKRQECSRLLHDRCVNSCSNDGGNIYSQDTSYRREFPPPSGAGKPAFLDFPTPFSPSYWQRTFPTEEIDSHHSSSLLEEVPPSLFTLEKPKQSMQRNSSFPVYQRDELAKDNISTHRPILDDIPSASYSLDFPMPSGANKKDFLDCPAVFPEESPILVEKMSRPSYNSRHNAERQTEPLQTLFTQDEFCDNTTKRQHCEMRDQFPQVMHGSPTMKTNMSPCITNCHTSQKRKPCCTRTINSGESPSSSYPSHRKHHSTCSKNSFPNLMDLSTKPDNSMGDFQLDSNFGLDSPSIDSPTSTINSADLSFELSLGADFQQNKPSTSVPHRRGPGRPRKPENERKRKPAKSIPLWKFILNMLHDPATCPELVRWEDPTKGTFRIVRSEQVAAKWGMRKDNTKMNYEKFSRAMRYYYKQHIFEAVPGKRLIYQFGRSAKDWRPKNMENPNFERRHNLD